MNSLPQNQSHLNIEQIEHALAGSLEEPLQEHLVQCELCRSEVELLRTVFGDLRVTMAATAESQWKTAVLRERKSVPRLAWAGAVAVLVVGLIIPFSPWVHPHQGEPPVAKPAPPADVTLSDEALLNGIQKDLSTSVPEPLEPLAGTQITNQQNRAQ